MKKDLSKRVHSSEISANKRAKFHVYYIRKNGKIYYDPSWMKTAAQAAEMIFLMCKEVFKEEVKIHKIVEVDQKTPLKRKVKCPKLSALLNL